MTEASNRCEKTNMTISVEGHPVALHFAKEPDVQVALKVKQALLGTYVAAGKQFSRLFGNFSSYPGSNVR